MTEAERAEHARSLGVHADTFFDIDTATWERFCKFVATVEGAEEVGRLIREQPPGNRWVFEEMLSEHFGAERV